MAVEDWPEEEESGGASEVGRGVVVAMETSEEVGTIWGEREEGKVTGKGSEVSVCALPIRRRSKLSTQLTPNLGPTIIAL